MNNTTVKFYYLFFALLILGGCSSSKDTEPVEYENLVQIQPPGETPNQEAMVYIDSVKTISPDSEKALLIYGTFPDACTHLGSATHNVGNDALKLNMTAWRNPKQMCAQVLTPFEFVYGKIPDSEISNHTKIYINGSTYIY